MVPVLDARFLAAIAAADACFAVALGFDNGAFLGNCIAKHTGMSPMQLRMHLRLAWPQTSVLGSLAEPQS